MKELKINGRNGIGKIVLVDDGDYEFLSQFNWFFSARYVRRNARENGKRTQKLLHSLLMPKKEGFVVDHINGNTLDNRRDNLRYATHQQNMANRKISKRNSSGYKSVYALKNKWGAQIQKEGKIFHIGVFGSKEDAAKAYNKAAKRLFGEFAALNNA